MGEFVRDDPRYRAAFAANKILSTVLFTKLPKLCQGRFISIIMPLNYTNNNKTTKFYVSTQCSDDSMQMPMEF